VIGMTGGGPVSWTRARAGLRYRVRDVEHTLPALDFGRSAPCLLRPAVLAAMRDVLGYAQGMLAANGIGHWLATGTLLGAYRHGGFVPCDDVIDLQVPLAHRAQLEALRPQLRRDGYRLLPAAGGYKLAPDNAWRHPYVDLIVVAERAGRMALAYPLDGAGRPTYRKAAQWPRECFPRADVFPLAAVPFEDLSLPVPRAGRELVAGLYGPAAMTTVWHRRWARWHNHLFMMTAFRLGLSGG
jgi:hypothetical protein